MDKTKIRWCDSTWNPATGCTPVSAECDLCYAEAVTNRYRSKFPSGFVPTWHERRLGQPASWTRPRRVFVNSMSDLFHSAFSAKQIWSVFDVMHEVDRHQYLVLTKRPKRMVKVVAGWLERVGLDEVPDHIWLGTSIGLNRYVWRADCLRQIPVPVRFLSCEPLLEPLPGLDLTGIQWVIVGGESGNGSNRFRPMDHEWARDLRDRARSAGAAFFFKQSAGPWTETGIELDGERIEEWPREHPASVGLRLPVKV